MEAEIKNAGKKTKLYINIFCKDIYIYIYLYKVQTSKTKISHSFRSDSYMLSMNPDPLLYLTWTKNPDLYFHLELICTKIYFSFIWHHFRIELNLIPQFPFFVIILILFTNTKVEIQLWFFLGCPTGSNIPLKKTRLVNKNDYH